MNEDHETIKCMHNWLNGEPVMSYDNILTHWGDDFEMYRLRWDKPPRLRTLESNIKRDALLFEVRYDWINKFGFAIPCAELLDLLKAYEPIVEIGAGSGYLTCLARNHGVDIIGTDTRSETHWFSHAAYDTHQLCVPGKTAVRRFSDMNVFCSWPSLSKTWFRQALKAMRIGQKIIVIEESCCAEETAWEYLETCFVKEKRLYIPSWPYMHDSVGVYRKRLQKAK